MTADLLTAFRVSVSRQGPKTALVDGTGRKTTFDALDRQIEGLAAYLSAAGIGKGDRVLLATPLDARLYASLAALWHVGAIAVFPEPALGLRGLRNAIRAVRPRAFLSAGMYRWMHLALPFLWGLRPLSANSAKAGSVPRAGLIPDDPALISFTSGSTGRPKVIVRSHGFMMAQWRAVAPLLDSAEDARDLVAFPVFALVNLAEGRTTVLPGWKLGQPQSVTAADLAKRAAETGSTRLLLPPAICETLARDGLPEGVTTVFTGGGPVYPDTVRGLLSQRPDLRLVLVYGSTEAEPIAEIDSADILPEDWQAMESGEGLLAGPPVPGLQLRLVDGEIQVAGDHVNRGYLDPSDDTDNKRTEGDTVWHRTGDAGRLDEKGRLWLLGRVRDAVDLNGRRSYPFQIETAARSWPGVRRAALSDTSAGPAIVIEGDPLQAPDWKERATMLGVDRVLSIDRMPMDARHGSKVDMAALRHWIARQS